MSGALLDLTAKNVQDSILIANPHITFFKKNHKRHTKFSKVEHNINFNSNLNFGSSTELVIPKLGDLIRNLILVIKLPKLKVPNNKILICDIKKFTNYNFFKNDHDEFTADDYNKLKNHNDNKIKKLEITEKKLSNMKVIIDTNYYDTYTDLVNSLIFLEGYDIEYKFIDAYYKDYPKIIPEYINNVSFFIENITRIIDGYSNVNIYLQKLNNIYKNEEFQNLEAYKIFEKYPNDILKIKSQILNTITIKKNIYSSLFSGITLNDKEYIKVNIDTSDYYDDKLQTLINKFYVKGISKYVYENINNDTFNLINNYYDTLKKDKTLIPQLTVIKQNLLKNVPVYEIGKIDHKLFYNNQTVFEYISDQFKQFNLEIKFNTKLNNFIKQTRDNINKFYSAIFKFFNVHHEDYFNLPNITNIDNLNRNIDIEHKLLKSQINNIDSDTKNINNNITTPTKEYCKLLKRKNLFTTYNLKVLHDYLWEDEKFDTNNTNYSRTYKKKFNKLFDGDYSIEKILGNTIFNNLYTVDEIINYVEEKINRIQNKINKLKYEQDEILNFYNKNYYFSWVHNIGTNIISKIHMYIGGQLITTYANNILNAEHDINKNVHKERGYNIMTGNICTMYSKNKSIPAYKLYIPLYSYSKIDIPIINLLQTEFKIFVQLEEFDKLICTNYFSILQNPPQVSCKLIGEYVYIEQKERMDIIKDNRDYIVNNIKNYFVQEYDHNDIDNNTIVVDIQINELVKEIVWFFCLDNDYIYKHQDKKCDDIQNISIMSGCTILFNDQIRQKHMEFGYYNYLVPYKVHNSIPQMGIYMYNFNICDDMVSGFVNASKLDMIKLEIKIDKRVTKYIKKYDKTIKFVSYCKCINVLRIGSGIGGLLLE